jgi:RNA polymerase sigma-70 factor (ECF subfamily)
MLLGTFRCYLARAGLAESGPALETAAQELLHEVVVEALQHEARFRAGGQPRAWLLGIAANLVKRRQVETARRNRREPLVRDLYPEIEQQMSDDELFDRAAALASVDLTDDLDSHAEATAMLAALGPDDQNVLRLAILHGLNGDALAETLGVTPGAARVRLHRALHRLRESYVAHKEDVND